VKKRWQKVSVRFYSLICFEYISLLLALIAYKLNKSLTNEADDDELEVEVATELASYAE
jgi:hypothetical protein